MLSYQQNFQPSYQQSRRGSSCNLNQSERLSLLHAEDKRNRSLGHLTPGVPIAGALGAAYPGVRHRASSSSIRKLQREKVVAIESLVEVNWQMGLDKRKLKRLMMGLPIVVGTDRMVRSGLFGVSISRDDTSVRNKTVVRKKRKKTVCWKENIGLPIYREE